MLKTAPVKRNTVDIDTRRNVAMLAIGRKPKEVAEVPHEQFIRRTLKAKLGWPQREQAPESIKQVAKEMAAVLVARDKEIADKNAARDAAVAQGVADNV